MSSGPGQTLKCSVTLPQAGMQSPFLGTVGLREMDGVMGGPWLGYPSYFLQAPGSRLMANYDSEVGVIGRFIRHPLMGLLESFLIKTRRT